MVKNTGEAHGFVLGSLLAASSSARLCVSSVFGFVLSCLLFDQLLRASSKNLISFDFTYIKWGQKFLRDK